VKTSQLEGLRQLGELRDKGLLTDEEFAEQKAALMGSGDAGPVAPGRVKRWTGRIAIVLALALGGAALAVAIDARNRASDNAKALRVQAAVSSHPKLVIENALSGQQSIPADGHSHRFYAECHPPGVALGGGFSSGQTGLTPEVLIDSPNFTNWLVVAATTSTGVRQFFVSATCAHGENGLTVEGPKV
jgi:hypothetical protein